jgi:hypothetical protein
MVIATGRVMVTVLPQTEPPYIEPPIGDTALFCSNPMLRPAQQA